jgi:hypothetical protein
VIWYLTRGTGPWHQIARAVLVFGLGWLTPHLLGGGLSGRIPGAVV